MGVAMGVSPTESPTTSFGNNTEQFASLITMNIKQVVRTILDYCCF